MCQDGKQGKGGLVLRTSLFVLVAVIAAEPVCAQTEQVRRGPTPDWVRRSDPLPVPDNIAGPVFMRRQDVLVHLDGKGQSQYTGYRVKILHSAALQLGNLSIAWNPAAGAPTVHEIKVYRDGQVTDVLQKSSFEILRREDQLEAARIDGILTAVLRIPDLRVGDELEVGMTTLSNDPTLGTNEAGIMFLQASPSPGRYHLGLSWDQKRAPNLKMTSDMAAIVTRGERDIDFRFDNPAALNPPKDAPPRYMWQRAVEFSDFSDWPAVSRYFAPLFTKAASVGPKSAIKQEARRIAAAHALPIDRVAAALKLVQQDVRYIYVGLNGGNLNPASADDTWQRRYGDCKGKTALLLALLNELGIKAEPVLVNSNGADDGLDQRLPMPQFFDHVLVRTNIDGTAYWLDGTLPAVVPPGTTPAFPLNWVLPLTTQGGSIERLAPRSTTTPDEINLWEIDARAGFDKPARITSTSIIRGVKGLQQQVQFSSASPDQLLNSFRQELVGDTWQVIEDVRWRFDQKAQASVLTVVGTGSVDWDDDGKGIKSLSLPGGGFSPPEKRVRAADQAQNAPFYSKPEFDCRVTTVRLPTSTQPMQWSANSGYDTKLFGRNYYRAFGLRDGAISMVRASRVERPETSATDAALDNAKIAGFDNSMAWIYYDPARKAASVGTGQAVPTTYDIDWTAVDVPCAAATTARPGT